MSKFKKLSQHIDALGGAVDQWPVDGPESGVTRREADAVVADLETSGQELEKFVLRAKETDPDRQMYGAKMCERVLALNERWGQWLEQAREVAAALPEDAADAAGAGAGGDSGGKEDELTQQEREEAAAAKEARRKAIEVEEAREREERARRAAEEEARRVEREREIAERNRRLEEEAAERAKQREAEHAREEARQARLAEAAERSPQEGVELLRSRVDGASFARIMGAIAAIVGGIAVEPADPARRHLRATNEALRRDVTGTEEGEEALVAVGFRLRELRQPLPGMYYVFPEEDTGDPDEWLAWFVGVKELAEYLARVAEEAQR